MSNREYIDAIAQQDMLPLAHREHLKKLKDSGFEPKVIYDIGSCVLHWTREAKKLWPNARYILFEAYEDIEYLYSGYEYYIGVLSSSSGKTIKWYQSHESFGGNSVYREKNDELFPEDKYIERFTTALDDIVPGNFPLPHLVKIDVQGGEIDVILGGIDTLRNAEHLLIELQNVNYNEGARMANESVPIIEKVLGVKCVCPMFSRNFADADYDFKKITV